MSTPTQCYRLGCTEPSAGTITHPYAPAGAFAYCEKHIPWAVGAPPLQTRCSCAALVLPGEDHRCFYSESLKLLERIASALESLVAAHGAREYGKRDASGARHHRRWDDNANAG